MTSSSKYSRPSKSLLGRREELARLREMDASGHLVEIVGLPGIGKSRLAGAFVESKTDERWMVFDLAGAEERGDVFAAIAARCDVELGPRIPGDERARQIGQRLESLGVTGVLLDDVDVPAAELAPLRELVDVAFGVTWIVTRRTPLDGISDTRLSLGPLDGEAARELYLSRAADHWLGPGSPDPNRRDVDRLVGVLNGHPLAIEQAAAQINAVPPGALAERVGGGGGSDRGAGETHPATTRLFEDAWTQLAPGERDLLALLSLFADEVPYTIVEKIERPEGESVNSHVEHLVQTRWLEPVDREAVGRAYRAPPLLREFVRNRTSGPEASERQERHARLVFECVDHLVARILDRGDPRAARELEWWIDDLRVLFDRWHREHPSRAFRALLPLRWLHRLGRPMPSIGQRLDDVLRDQARRSGRGVDFALLALFGAEVAERTGDGRRAAKLADLAVDRLPREPTEPDERAAAVEVLGTAGRPSLCPDQERGGRRIERARDLADDAEFPVLSTRRDESSGFRALQRSALEAAQRAFESAQSTLQRADNVLFLPPILTGLGFVAHRRDTPELAENVFRRAIEIHTDLERNADAAGAEFNLGVLLLDRRPVDEAAELLERSAEKLGSLGRGMETAAARLRLGVAQLELGRGERARSSLHEALDFARRSASVHHRAAAEGILALVDEESPPDRVVAAIDDIAVDSAPDLAASMLVCSVVGFVQEGRDPLARRRWNQLVELHGHIGEDDRYFQRVVRAVLEAGRGALEASEFGGVSEEAGDTSTPESLASFDNAFARLAGRVLVDRTTQGVPEPASRVIPAAEEESHRLRVHRRGHWFVVDDEAPVDLTSRDPLRRILGAIVDATSEEARAGVDVDELVSAGWPDAVPTESSGANRVYYSVRKLREFGLEDILVTGETGYRFADAVKVRISSVPYDDLDRFD